ncbi:MAG TPA: DNA repair protein RecN [Polyangiaceae bacterium]|nr:DNA repair protein RecN [Polyangiaceae bacterium]
MLSCLKIRDLAIIDELELELGPGLNVLTGETGAGKSILVSALELVLGGKGRAELVRSGARDGEVEALFDVSGDARVQRQLEELEMEAEGELVVRRVISATGRTRCFVNGKLATQQVLAELTRGLTDISSQHEHHTLSDPSTHLGYLDAFAGAGALRQRMSRAYHALRQAEAVLRDFEARLRDRDARESVLHAQLQEIRDAAPELDEDAALEQRCQRLRSVESLLRLTGEAAELLYERDDSVADGLAQAGRRVAEAAELDPALAPLSLQLEALRNQLEDAARELGRHVLSVRADPDELQRTEERLYELCRLKRRYGGSLEQVLAYLEKGQAELEELQDHGKTSETLQLARTQAFEEARSVARTLSLERQQAASKLAEAISRELDSLGMGGARIHVELLRSAEPRGADLRGTDLRGTELRGTELRGTELGHAEGGAGQGLGELSVDGARLSADGLERAEFLIAPNRGEEARSLHKVASGGELSRAMLAIKCVLADLGPAGMYVFDEIDSGVGGGMAEIIGRKVRRVASHRQVLCITHLPQIAVFADQHFKVEKSVRAGRTLSTVRRLSVKEQAEEIARMLGGLKITTKTRAAAQELLLQARQAVRRCSVSAGSVSAGSVSGRASAGPVSGGAASGGGVSGGGVSGGGVSGGAGLASARADSSRADSMRPVRAGGAVH